MRFDFLVPILNAGVDVPFFTSIQKHLVPRGVSVAYVTNMRDVQVELSRHTEHSFYLYETFDPSHQRTTADFERIERRYRLASLEDHIYTEASYDWGRDATDLRNRAVHTFDWLEAFLGEHDVGAFINVIGGELLRRSMARITDLGGPRNIIVDFAPLHGRIALTTNEQGFIDLPRPLPELTPEARQRAEAFIARATQEKKLFVDKSNFGLAAENFVRAGKLAVRMARGASRDVNYGRLVEGRIKRVARRALTSSFYEQVVPGEPYIFFPLHLINDSVITIRAPQFERQDVLIEHIIKHCIPVGHALYVKPHIGARDAYPIDFLKRVRAIPRVRLLDPTLNPHDLIQNAAAVLVINSTVGFEALLWQKPVVVVGRPSYYDLGLTKDVGNLTDLGVAIRDALGWTPDREQLLRFIASLHDHTYPGVYGDASPENTAGIAAALIERARGLGVRLASLASPSPS